MGRLEENRKYYELCIPILKKLYEANLYEDCILYAQKLAYHCWHNFSGLYHSYEIESVLNNIGYKILPAEIHEKKDLLESNNKHILHICSELYETGGHSKLLYRWIANDTSRQHSILNTRLKQHEVERLTNIYQTNSVENIYTLTSSSLIDQAKELLEYVCAGYEFIVLHIHPDEVLTNIVLSHPKFKVPVLFMNHAEHTFWLGAQITDVLIQIKEQNIAIDKIRRSIYTNFYLPIPIDAQPTISNLEPNDDQTVRILSIGSEFKYTPTEEYNFYKEIVRLVQDYTNIEVYIIGVSSDDPFAVINQHPRINYLGYLSPNELTKYRESCSIYLEGFPVPSFTALLETALFKKPFLLQYDPYPVYTLFSNNEAIKYPNNVSEWREILHKLITDQDYRMLVSQAQYDTLIKDYSLESWHTRLQNLYRCATKLDTKKKQFESIGDKFYNTENEEIVVKILHSKIHHLSYTENLNLLTKIKIWRYRPRTYSMVNEIRGQHLFKFFTPNLFYLVKRIFRKAS